MSGKITNKSMKINLTEVQLDILKELGNIGSGHAITALSDLLNKKIEVSLTSADINLFWKVPEMFNNHNKEVVVIYSEIPFNSDLTIIQIFSKKTVINLINLLSEFKKSADNISNINDLDDFSYSIIYEIGNILSGHYASALADLLSIKLMLNVPKIAIDSLNAILEGIIAKYSQVSDYIITINTGLKILDINLEGTICFIPPTEILVSLFEILNINYEMEL